MWNSRPRLFNSGTGFQPVSITGRKTVPLNYLSHVGCALRTLLWLKTKNDPLHSLTPGEEPMIGALARQVQDGDWAAGGALSPMPAAALWLAPLTHAPRAEVFVAGSPDWPFAGEWQGFFDLCRAYPLFAARLQIPLC
jgi:hypothetical protein